MVLLCITTVVYPWQVVPRPQGPDINHRLIQVQPVHSLTFASFPDLRCCTVDLFFDCNLGPDDATVALDPSSPGKSAEILFKRST